MEAALTETGAPSPAGPAGQEGALAPRGAGARSLQLAVIFLLLLALVALCRATRPAHARRCGPSPARGARWAPLGPTGPRALGAPRGGAEGRSASAPDIHGPQPERQSVHDAERRLYSTADVDRLVAGPLNAWWREDGRWAVYAQRTSHGDEHGLTEYSSSGLPGEVGVDVGPIGLAEYGGRSVGYDDGIPEAWRLPSTPIRWYRPRGQDYYGHDGATPYAFGVYSLTEPDHEPLVA